MDSGSKQLLGVKVMRLTKPSLMTSVPVMGEPWDILGKQMEEESGKDVCCTKDLTHFSMGEMLMLPQNFGNIYLGETFNAFVTFMNEGLEPLKEVFLKVELITPTNRISLMDKTVPQIDPEEYEKKLISYEVKELGDHSLSCTGTFIAGSNPQELLQKKLFRFSVGKPLDVRTKFMNIEDGSVLLEVQIQNTMPYAMHLDTVHFDPVSGFTLGDYNTRKPDNNNVETSVFGDDNILSSRATRQYLYHIRHTSSGQSTFPGGKPKVIGKMDIVWRTRLGEKGRIQTGQLKATQTLPSELNMTLLRSPGTVHIEQAFCVTYLVTNNSDHPMRLKAILERSPDAGIVWSGVSGQIHELLAGQSLHLTLTAVSVLSGIQNFPPICLVDTLSNQRHYSLRIGQVYVEPTSNQGAMYNEPTSNQGAMYNDQRTEIPQSC